MPVPDQSRVMAILSGTRQAALCEVITRAWARWLSNPEKAQLYRRTRACLMHNYMMLEAIRDLPQDDGIKPVERQETALFLIDDELAIRFKKGDENGLSSNIGTQAALDYNDPEESLALFDLPDICRVDIVYKLNEYETQIQDVCVVARDNERVAWSYSILQQGADEMPIPMLPIEPQPQPPAETGIRVPDTGNQEKKREADGTA